MLPTNVMSFMKKMVATDGASTTSAETADAGTTFGKIRQTLSSSLMTAQDKVTKMSPRPSIIPDSEAATAISAVEATPSIASTTSSNDATGGTGTNTKPEPGKPPSRTNACRVCLKSFKPDDISHTCAECSYRVCEDCASYSKLDVNEDQSDWKCSVCRRKLQSRIAVQQDSTDSLLEVPILEALQRRHSDVKIGGGGLTPGGGSGLAPPRSPELRRHSDVSPASLKELEKNSHSVSHRHSTKHRKMDKKRSNLKSSGQKTPGDLDWARSRGGSRSVAPSRSSSPPRRDSIAPSAMAAVAAAAAALDQAPAASPRGRRMSRVTRQHSYDDEIKSGTAGAQTEGAGLGLPAMMPRRASAYDVYAPGVLAAARASAAASGSNGGGGGGDALPVSSITARRPSFRVPVPDEPTKDSSPSPEASPSLIVDEDRRNRRRGSQLPDIAALRALPQTPWSAAALEELEAPRRQASVDGEAIKIVIHDVDSGLPLAAAKRRVVLRRDPTDKAHRTRGFGMRVVGGKTGVDGRLFAYIVWTVPGGPAEKGGLQQGDKVLEWCGVPLTDRSFEEVCAIMDRTGDTAELLVEHATDFRMCDLLEEPMPMQRKASDASATALQIEAENDKTPSSPTRRKLPKTPEQMAREKQVSGRVQLQVWYHDERRELVVAVLAGDDLAPRDDSLGYGSLPEAYAKLRLIPSLSDAFTVQTEVAPASPNPIWNANLSFPGVPGDELMDKSIELTLWDLCPQNDTQFLGECTVDLQKAFLDDRAIWCRLEDPRGLRGGIPTVLTAGKSPHTSPRGSIAEVSRLMRKGDFGAQRSVSDDVDSIGECTSLLHPDHAWIAGSRRGSSQSEQLEVEVYQLGKDFSRSLPGSRRSSFQSADKEQNEIEACPPPETYNRGRRRSSCTRMLRDPDEILRSLKAVKGELGRTMSLSGSDKRGRRTSTSSRKNSVLDIPECVTVEDKGVTSEEGSPDGDSPTGFKLGPGQIQPRGYRMSAGRHGELKLGLLMTKGQLEVDVVCARSLGARYNDNPPDTYVKCYLRDGDRWLQKRKTRVARHSVEPQYRQTLKYQACDVLGRTLLVMLWERQGGFEHNQGIGGAEVALDSLTLTHLIVGWYPLFPIHSLGSDSNDSP